MSVRPLAEADLPQVTELFWRHMRRGEGPIPPQLQPTFRDLYFTNPWIDGTIPSLVYEDKDGKIIGFLGVVVRRMLLGEQTIRIAFGGNFVVQPGTRSNLAGPRLLGAYMAAGYDIFQTDSANDVSRRLLERIGFRTISALSIHWARPLLPVHYGIHAMTRITPPAVGTPLKIIATPFAAVADAIATRLSFSPFRQTESRLQGSELDLETLLQCLGEWQKGYSMWADYDAKTLGWLLNYMQQRGKRGRIRRVVVRDENQKIVGWYIYYVQPGAIGEVVQIGADPKFTKDVLDHLFHDGWKNEVIALHGVADIRRMPDFSDKGCLFTCRGGWNVAFSRKPELIQMLEQGDVLLTRLDGEWCLDPGD
jgi:hypothetical protein